MISRRHLLAGASLAAIVPLAGCNSKLGAEINAGIDAIYNDLVAAAKVLEAAIITAAKDAKAAAAAVAPYAVACCKLTVSMDTLSQTLIQQGTLAPASGSKLASALGTLHTAATTGLIAQTAANGAPPSDPLTLATDIIQIASLVVSATGRKVTPSAAAVQAS